MMRYTITYRQGVELMFKWVAHGLFKLFTVFRNAISNLIFPVALGFPRSYSYSSNGLSKPNLSLFFLFTPPLLSDYPKEPLSDLLVSQVDPLLTFGLTNPKSLVLAVILLAYFLSLFFLYFFFIITFLYYCILIVIWLEFFSCLS